MDLFPVMITAAVMSITIISGGVFLIIYNIKRVINKRKLELEEKFRGRRILLSAPNANFFGRESLGRGQLRGNGTLILTADELFFSLWLPKREFRIPLAAATGVETPRSHLGKSVGRKLLKVNYTNQEAKPDAIGWLVPDLEQWTKQLENLLKQ